MPILPSKIVLDLMPCEGQKPERPFEASEKTGNWKKSFMAFQCPGCDTAFFSCILANPGVRQHVIGPKKCSLLSTQKAQSLEVCENHLGHSHWAVTRRLCKKFWGSIHPRPCRRCWRSSQFGVFNSGLGLLGPRPSSFTQKMHFPCLKTTIPLNQGFRLPTFG